MNTILKEVDAAEREGPDTAPPTAGFRTELRRRNQERTSSFARGEEITRASCETDPRQPPAAGAVTGADGVALPQPPAPEPDTVAKTSRSWLWPAFVKIVKGR